LIRVAYPVPPVRQFRLRLELATRRTRRAIEQRRRDLRGRDTWSRNGGLTAAPDTFSEANSPNVSWREDICHWRAAYNEFEDRYDRLVGLLCLAAHEGVTAKGEEAYKEQRIWFLQNYTEVQRELGRYLRMDPSDTTPGLWGRRPCDAYEALFLPNSLDAMLNADNGNLIGRLTRTQEALTAWDDSLRRSEQVLAAE
jgi:hypothetical protein